MSGRSIPLSDQLGVSVAIDGALGEGMGPKAVDAFGGWLGRRLVVLCTHGDVVEALLGSVVEAGVDLGSAASAAKGSVWVIEGGHRAGSRSTVSAPPA